MTSPTDLPKDYDLDEVAAALRMSARWVRQKVAEGAVHNRYGHKIRFTAEQVQMLKDSHTRAPKTSSITTGRKRKTA